VESTISFYTCLESFSYCDDNNSVLFDSIYFKFSWFQCGDNLSIDVSLYKLTTDHATFYLIQGCVSMSFKDFFDLDWGMPISCALLLVWITADPFVNLSLTQ
jgi:hypothetical protein